MLEGSGVVADVRYNIWRHRDDMCQEKGRGLFEMFKTGISEDVTEMVPQ